MQTVLSLVQVRQWSVGDNCVFIWENSPWASGLSPQKGKTDRTRCLFYRSHSFCPCNHRNGLWPLKSTEWQQHFLNLTSDIGLGDMRHEGDKCSDMGHIHILNSTCDIEETYRQRHAMLPFLKMDMRHWGPPIKGPTEPVSANLNPFQTVEKPNFSILMLTCETKVPFTVHMP